MAASKKVEIPSRIQFHKIFVRKFKVHQYIPYHKPSFSPIDSNHSVHLYTLTQPILQIRNASHHPRSPHNLPPLGPLIIAASTPTCIPSTHGYNVPDATTHYTSFCSKLASESFVTDEVLYGTPVSEGIISFNFTSTPNTNTTTCDVTMCLADFGSLVQNCKSHFPS